MNVDEARARVLEALTPYFPQAGLNDYGSIIIQLPDTLVVCKFREAATGDAVVTIEAPVLLEIPAKPDLYELLAVSAVSFPLGTFSVGAGETRETLTLAFSAKWFVDGVPPDHFVRAVNTVHAEAVNQMKMLKPMGGGYGVYEQPG